MKNTFRGGVHPLKEIHEGKRLTEDAVPRFVAPGVVTIPVGMHLGAPSAPCVQKGDVVKLGQVIAEPVGGLGLPVHASVSGTVTAVDDVQLLRGAPEKCIVIQNDMLDDAVDFTPAGGVETVDPSCIIPAVKAAGVCGMGGAAFPTHIKLSVPEGKHADVVIINGAECEPYLTCDYRNMLDFPERILDGLRLAMRATGVERGVIAVESNKPKAIAILRAACEGRTGCEVMELKTKYPQGGEKTLIEVVTGRQVPRGKLPIDAGALVFNISTAIAMADAVTLGRPLIERVTTVTGAVKEPGNLRLRIGTSFEEAVAACGGLLPEAVSVFAGGPMTAPCAPSLAVSVTKAGGGILAFTKDEVAAFAETACIRCGRCISACPMRLLPYEMKFDIEQGELERAKSHGLMDCVLCGACAYVCPARRPLTAAFKTAREELAAKARR